MVLLTVFCFLTWIPGKTSTMLSLCHGQRASSDSNMMLPAGDGRVLEPLYKSFQMLSGYEFACISQIAF